MTACTDMRMLMQALIDGELDAANALRCEEHLATCPACAAAYEGHLALRQALKADGVYRPAPDALRARVDAALDAAAPRNPLPSAVRSSLAQRARDAWRRWGGVASGLALAASLALFVATPLRGPSPDEELVAGHVRSLLVNHLTDVATSNQHVVKPWFAGKLDFSPPVADLADAGFPLVGGRLDYLGGRPVAALVFRRRDHVINLFIAPGNASAAASAAAVRDGYNILPWSEGGMTFHAVSDLNLPELREFQKQFVAHDAGR